MTRRIREDEHDESWLLPQPEETAEEALPKADEEDQRSDGYY